MNSYPESGTVGELLRVLRLSADAFKAYAVSHRSKKPADDAARADNDAKIQRNVMLSDLIDKTLKDYEISATAETTCPTCNAPCVQTTYPRGGDYGWGDDSTRIRFVYIAPKAESQSLAIANMQLQATVELLKSENASLKQRISSQESDAAWERDAREGRIQGGV